MRRKGGKVRCREGGREKKERFRMSRGGKGEIQEKGERREEKKMQGRRKGEERQVQEVEGLTFGRDLPKTIIWPHQLRKTYHRFPPLVDYEGEGRGTGGREGGKREGGR